MRIWSITTACGSVLVPGSGINDALTYFRNILEFSDEPTEVRAIGTLELPAGCISGKQSLHVTPTGWSMTVIAKPENEPRNRSEAVKLAIMTRGKTHGFARDLIQFIPQRTLEKYWPGMGKNGLAKSISLILDGMQLKSDNGDPKFWTFTDVLDRTSTPGAR